MSTNPLPTMQYLFVSSCLGLPEEVSIALIRRMPNLSSVVFAQTKVSDATIRCLADTCRDLRELDLSMSEVSNVLLEVCDLLPLSIKLCMRGAMI